MACKCLGTASSFDLIDILINRGYYVDKSDNLLKNMDTDEMIDELKSRGIMVDRTGEIQKLYYDAITDKPLVFQQKLNWFFEKLLNKRM